MLTVIAAISWGTTGTALAVHGNRSGRLLGVGLLSGALLTMVDTTTAPRGLPLAAWSLAVFGGLRVWAPVVAERHAGWLAVVSGLLLHWLHGAAPQQPLIGSWLVWQPLAVMTAAALCWLATRSRHGARWLFGCCAVGAMLAAIGGRFAGAWTATGMIAGCWPMLRPFVRVQPRTVAIAAASAIAMALPLSLRAAAAAAGTPMALAGMPDPMFVIAALFAAFGLSLLRAQQGETSMPDAVARPVAVDAPTLPTTPVDAATRPVTAPGQATAPPARDAAVETREQLTAADVIRDLREPLTNMLAAVHLAQADDADQGSRAMLGRLRTYSEQLSQAVSDVNELEALVSGEFELAEDVFDLPELFRACTAEVQPKADERHVPLHCELSPSLPRWVQGDPARTRQLFSRLLNLTIRRHTLGQVDVWLSAGSDDILLTVQNCHAEPDHAEDVALLFTGRLAEEMGGSVTVRGREEGGLEIRASLPKVLAPDWEVELLEQDTARALPHDAEPTAGEGSDRHLRGSVLLITGNRDHRELIARMLDSTGAEVATANGTDMAIHLLAERSFDLLLLDAPDLAVGVETASNIRQQGGTAPMIALTADGSSTSVEQLLAAGCNSHLHKPIDARMLRGALAMHLDAASP